MSATKIYNRIRDQTKSVEFWIGNHKKCGNESSLRNAAFSLGRLQGLFMAAREIDEDNIPVDIQAISDKYETTWQDL